MQNTWRAIVDVACPERACVYCGQAGDVGGRLVEVAAVRALLRSQHGMAGEELHSTYANLCMCATAYTDVAEAAADVDAVAPLAYDHFGACSCCAHWIKRRAGRPHFMFPLQALKLHLLCLPVVAGKTMDARVAQRLSAALACDSNFFRAAFSSAELAVCAQIAEAPLSSVTSIVALFVHEQNARSPFLRCAKLCEIVRGATSARTSGARF